MTTLLLAQAAADVQAAVAEPSLLSAILSPEIISALGTGIVTLAGFLIRTYVKNKQAAAAFEMISVSAANGVKAAWTTYTEGKKAASEDGKLTAEEGEAARQAAIAAALASLGDSGKKVVVKVFKGESFDRAIQAAIEQEYASFRQAKAPAGNNGTPANGSAPVSSGGAGGTDPKV